MAGVTLKVLHGADRGKVFQNLTPPFTVGREEINDIQLNDERVSRCHFKIQRDNDRLVLTDLDSTNGTRVNGQECQLKILRQGDFVGLGRSTIFVGSDAEYAERMARPQPDQDDERTISRDPRGGSDSSSGVDFELNQNPVEPASAMLGTIEPPRIPDHLTPVQAAQLCEILEYYHRGLQGLIETAAVDEADGKVTLPLHGWQRLLQAQARLAVMIRNVADPEWPQ